MSPEFFEDGPTPTDPNGSGLGANGKRRSVACKSCHSLKVKCTPLDPDDPNGPCVRCSKTGRICEIDLSQPRRRKRKLTAQIAVSEPKFKVESPANPQGSELEFLRKRIKTLEEELVEQHKPEPSILPLLKQGYYQQQSGGPHQHLQQHTNGPVHQANGLHQQHLPVSASSYSSPGTSFHSPPVQQQIPNASLYPYNNNPVQSQQKASPNQFSSVSPSPYPVALPPLQRSQQSPYLATPHNIEVSPNEIMDNESQILELQNELNTLMNTQKQSLSKLTSDVLEVAEKRKDLINETLGINKFDCVDLGYISIEEADKRLRMYREVMYAEYPFIEIPKDLTALELRHSHKFLFTTIMSITAILIPKESVATENQMKIDLCNIRMLVTEVLIVGTKSLELLKCLLLVSLWYNSAELFHHRRYHLINTLCVSMVHDLGLTGRPYYFYNKEEGSVKKTKASETPQSLEYRRLLMTVYFISISISLFLRKRIQVYWSSYLQESCELLEATGNEGDLKIAILGRLNRMLERIHFIIHNNQEADDSAFSQPDRIKYIISELQRDLSNIKAKIPKDDHYSISYYYSVQAYLHEPTLHKLFASEVLKSVPTSLVASVDKCSRSCIAALEEQKLASAEDLTMMPLLHTSRVIYTAGMLLRLRYLVISIPSLCFASFFPKDSIERIQVFASNVNESSQKYPSNNFLHKIRLVIALFSQTYSTQLQKLINDKIQKNKLNPKNRWSKDDDVQSLHILSQAAEQARFETQTPQSNGSQPNNNKPETSPSSNVPPADNNDLEFSYYALNDEFWSDLLLKTENTDEVPQELNLDKDPFTFLFDNDFI